MADEIEDRSQVARSERTHISDWQSREKLRCRCPRRTGRSRVKGTIEHVVVHPRNLSRFHNTLPLLIEPPALGCSLGRHYPRWPDAIITYLPAGASHLSILSRTSTSTS